MTMTSRKWSFLMTGVIFGARGLVRASFGARGLTGEARFLTSSDKQVVIFICLLRTTNLAALIFFNYFAYPSFCVPQGSKAFLSDWFVHNFSDKLVYLYLFFNKVLLPISLTPPNRWQTIIHMYRISHKLDHPNGTPSALDLINFDQPEHSDAHF